MGCCLDARPPKPGPRTGSVAEAAERGISTEDHATHLLVHGTLHLLGYDHLVDDEAETMEEIERAALASLGLADPYLIRED